MRVQAAAIKFPDILILRGRYQVRLDPPFVPGGEFAGVVAGSPVGWATMGTPVTGMVASGALGQYVVADLEQLRPMPRGLDPVHAAGFSITYRTAYHALVTIADAAPGQVAVVTGAAGGVGLATVDLAHRLGLRVIAAASSAERLELCRRYGADETVDYSVEPLKDRVKSLVDTGVDVVVDPVGGPYVEAALRTLRWGGRFVTVGYAAGEIPRIPLNLVLLKGAIVRGVELRGIAENIPGAVTACDEALARFVGEGLRPHVGAQFSLADVRTALHQVADRRALGKVVITIP